MFFFKEKKKHFFKNPKTNQKSGPDLIGPLSLLSECLYGSPGTRFTSMVLLVAGAIIASTTNATDARG